MACRCLIGRPKKLSGQMRQRHLMTGLGATPLSAVEEVNLQWQNRLCGNWNMPPRDRDQGSGEFAIGSCESVRKLEMITL